MTVSSITSSTLTVSPSTGVVDIELNKSNVVTQVTSTGGTIAVASSPSGGTGIVNVEAIGTAISNLPAGATFIVNTDPMPFEHAANTNTYQITVGQLFGLFAVKQAVNTVYVTNVGALSGVPGSPNDGVTVVAGNLVLLTAQTNQYQNGPWVIPATGAWTRPVWYVSGGVAQAYAGITIQILSGTKYGGTWWTCTTTGTITIDTTNTSWSQISLGSSAQALIGGSNTYIQYNNNGAFAGTNDFTFNHGTETMTVGYGAGNNATITTGTTGSTSTGLDLTVQAGSGGLSSGQGGALYLSGGSSSSGNSGAVGIYTRNATGISNSAGAIGLNGGNGIGGGGGGGVALSAGAGGATGSGGSAGMGAGDSGPTGGNGGNISFSAGTGNGATSNGGVVSFTSGSALGSGAGGDISFHCGSSITGRGGNITVAPGPGSNSPTYDGIVQFTTAYGINSLAIDQNANVILASGNPAAKYVGGYGAFCDQSYATIVSGTSTTIPNYTNTLLINLSGTVPAFNVTMPAIPVDGQIVEISSTHAISTLTVTANTGQSIQNSSSGGSCTIGSFGVANGASWRYILGLTEWVRRY